MIGLIYRAAPSLDDSKAELPASLDQMVKSVMKNFSNQKDQIEHVLAEPLGHHRK